MRTGLARMTNAPLFAAWDARLLQHVLLLPLLLVSFWASLRMQWRPLWLALPLQVILGVVFAAMAYPAMLLAETHSSAASRGIFMSMAWRMRPRLPGPTRLLSLWLASFVSFPAGLWIWPRADHRPLRCTRAFGIPSCSLAALEREWSAARLAALRMQLSPHTLFNLLHTIRGTHRMGSEGCPVDGRAARGSAAPAAQRGRTRLRPADR
jgi:hypothetical protein